MTFPVQPEVPPIHEDETGALRIGDSRVVLELVIEAFQDGVTAEAIVQRYPTLMLSDVYFVIGHYLRHRSEVDEYLQRRNRLSAEVQNDIEKGQADLREIRARLQARRRAG